VSVVPDPSLLVVQSARAQEILAAVRRLKPKDREIVMLYAWEDLSRETIARMMGMTRSALDQRIHRANKRLAQILEPGPELIPSPPIAQEGGGS
jgi:RNA polymerase sigma-70 factor (ECF subfamily)